MVLHQIFSTFHCEFSVMKKFLPTATNSALRFNTPMQPYVLIYPPKPYSIDFWPQTSHMLSFSIKTHQCGMNFSIKSPYPILEFEQITSFKILAIPPLEFQPWTHAYAATNIFVPNHQNFLLFITKPASKFMCMQPPKFVFPSLHFHHKFCHLILH